MLVLLIRPPARYERGAISPSINLPLGLMSIAAVLEQNGYPVTLYDAQVNLTNPVTSFDTYLHMGDLWEDVEKVLTETSPDIIGINCQFSTQFNNAIHLANIARKIHPRSLIVVGGAHPSVRPADFLTSDSAVDVVCTGEGEYTLLEIVRIVNQALLPEMVLGTAHRFSGNYTLNPPRPKIMNLDELPFPAYHLVRMNDYFRLFREGYTDRPTMIREGVERAVSLITSRGCPFNCVFCSIHLHMGKRWREHSVAYVIKQITMLVADYGINHIHFEDDNISFSQQRFTGILDGLAGMPSRITWDTPNGVRVDTLTEELINRCKDSGCSYLVFGVESGNQRVLNTIIDKELDLGKVLSVAAWCKSAGLDAMAFFVIGFPGENSEEMRDTVTFALRLLKEFDVTPLLFIATPLPGTRLEEMFLEKKLLPEPLRIEQLAAITQGHLYLDGGTFSAKELEDIRVEFSRHYRKIFILKTVMFFLVNPSAFLKLIRLMPLASKRLSLKEKILMLFSIKNSCLNG